MAMDDCFIPRSSPLHEHAPTPYDLWQRGSHPCLSQLDLDERASADSGKVDGGGSHGENGAHIRTMQILNRLVSIPPRRLPPPICPLPTYKENEDLLVSPAETPLPEEPKQHHQSQVAVSRAASKGRYASSKAGWMSKERSTPEGIDLEKHARMFEFPLRDPPSNPSLLLEIFSGPQVVMKKRKPPEVRNALRERRVMARQRVARNHAEVALRKYNRANNTKFELVEIREISIFFEFGGGCVHYNFTAKQPEDHDDSADADSTKLFFSEVDYPLRSENDVLLCCIVGENDAGHCYGCLNYRPVVHPSSQAYGGGSSTCIDYPGSDGDSTDSD
ncbi:hypothetical protein ACQ4PT_000742 [Festuca glaucescens]